MVKGGYQIIDFSDVDLKDYDKKLYSRKLDFDIFTNKKAILISGLKYNGIVARDFFINGNSASDDGSMILYYSFPYFSFQNKDIIYKAEDLYIGISSSDATIIEVGLTNVEEGIRG